MERPLAIQTVVTCVLTIRLCEQKRPRGQQHGDCRMLFISKAIKVFAVLFVHGLTSATISFAVVEKAGGN